MDVDLRKLRYFVAVAERLHFGCAAEDLHIAQPVLSRQIRALEHELGAELFVRDRRSTALTPAGEQLLADARPLLANAEALRRRVARAARGPRVFTVGFMPGLIVTASIRVLRQRHPDLTIDVVRTGFDDQTEVVRDGRVDVSLIRLPADQRGLRVQPLVTEPRVVVLPADHRLAHKDVVNLADLAGERLLQHAGAVPEWPPAAREPAAREPGGGAADGGAAGESVTGGDAVGERATGERADGSAAGERAADGGATVGRATVGRAAGGGAIVGEAGGGGVIGGRAASGGEAGESVTGGRATGGRATGGGVTDESAAVGRAGGGSAAVGRATGDSAIGGGAAGDSAADGRAADGGAIVGSAIVGRASVGSAIVGRAVGGPALRTVEEKLEHVAAGVGVVVLPLSTARFYPRRDVVYVAVDDLGPSEVCLAWDGARRTPLIQEYAAIVADQGSAILGGAVAGAAV